MFVSPPIAYLVIKLFALKLVILLQDLILLLDLLIFS